MTSEKENMESHKEIVVCGGTFDHFHKGHADFLASVIAQNFNIVIGVTSDEFVTRLKDDSIESYEARKKSVEDYLKSKGRGNYEIICINDLFGPTLDSKYSIYKLVVSELTQKGAEIINQKRKERGLKSLPVEIVSLAKSEEGGIISSTRIRNGEIDREGKLNINPEWFKKDRSLPHELRLELAKPKGPFIDNIDAWISSANPTKTIVVGDVVSRAFNLKNFGQILSVIDFQVARKKRHNSIEDLGFSTDLKLTKIVNPAGTLSSSVFTQTDKFFTEKNRSRSVFVIEGEEDLVVLPLLLRAPIGFTIVYGQPNEGMVSIVVNEEIKKLAYNIVDHFTVSMS